MGRLEGKRAIITGGASGLGAAIAHRFAGEGALVGVIDLPRMAERGLGVANELNEAGAQAAFVAGDVLDADSIRAAIDQPPPRSEGLTSASCCGRFLAPMQGFVVSSTLIPITSTSSTVDARRVPPPRSCRTAHDRGRPRGQHRVVGIDRLEATVAGVQRVEGRGVDVTRSLAEDCANKIRVNAIGPAYVTTMMLAGIVSGAAATTPSRNRRGTTQRAASLPLGALPSPLDIANTVLCSCAATRQRCSPDRSCIPTVE